MLLGELEVTTRVWHGDVLAGRRAGTRGPGVGGSREGGNQTL